MAKAKTKSNAKAKTTAKPKLSKKAKAPARAKLQAKPAAKSSKKRVTLTSRVSKFVDAAKGAVGLGDPNDLVSIILEDHKMLKDLIKQMKDSDLSLDEREAAFAEFAPALLAHARPEELTLYTSMKSDGEMREDGFEGDVEHGLADQMIEEAKRTEDKDLLGARIKVLAELVEHHIQEEEESMLPEYRANTEEAERIRLGQKFLILKAEIQADGADDAPPEILIAEASKRKSQTLKA